MRLFGVHISEGNRKLGNIPSFSVPAVLTCQENVPCKQACYALKLEKRWKNVRTSYMDNYYALTSEKGYSTVLTAVNTYINCSGTKYFRWNVSGDFFSMQYLQLAINVARENPNTFFVAYTKQFRILNAVMAVTSWPENFMLYASEWGDYKPTFTWPFRAVYEPKGDFIQGYHCPGNCFECKACYNGVEKIVFPHH